MVIVSKDLKVIYPLNKMVDQKTMTNKVLDFVSITMVMKRLKK